MSQEPFHIPHTSSLVKKFNFYRFLPVIIDKNVTKEFVLLSQKAAERVKIDGLDNDLVERIKK